MGCSSIFYGLLGQSTINLKIRFKFSYDIVKTKSNPWKIGGELSLFIFLSILESDNEKKLFAKLYHQYVNTMLKVAKRYFPDDLHTAEDAVQNAWVRVANSFQKVQAIPSKKRGAYLVIIVKNEAISILRKKRIELPLDEGIASSYSALGNGDAKTVIEIIQTMPDTYRAVLEMRFVEELSTKEISTALGLSETAVNVRIHRGREILINKLRKEGYDR
mgnify:CR=1 FL=1